MPPIEWPTIIALSIFKLSSSSLVLRAHWLKLYGIVVGFEDRP
jgi:hypothetical protein